MALGAVATGSMKPTLAASTAGNISSAGSAPTAIAVAARIGISSTAVAVLLAISDSSTTPPTMPSSSSGKGRALRPESPCATASLRPEDWKAVASAMPPPNSTSAPQGIFSAVSQSSSWLPRPSGITHSATTASSATLASLAPGSPSSALQPPKGSLRKIHAAAVSANTASTRFSPAVQAPLSGSTAAGAPARPRPSHHAITGRNSSTTGTPIAIQSRKP